MDGNRSADHSTVAKVKIVICYALFVDILWTHLTFIIIIFYI